MSRELKHAMRSFSENHLLFNTANDAIFLMDKEIFLAHGSVDNPAESRVRTRAVVKPAPTSS